MALYNCNRFFKNKSLFEIKLFLFRYFDRKDRKTQISALYVLLETHFIVLAKNEVSMLPYADIGNEHSLFQKSKPEFKCFVDVIQNHLRRDVDLIGLLLMIKRNGFISDEMFASQVRKVIHTTILVSECLPLIYFLLSFEQFCFEENGYTTE